MGDNIKFLKAKVKAMDSANIYYNQLLQEIDIEFLKRDIAIQRQLEGEKTGASRRTPTRYLNYIYENKNFQEFMKYSFQVKECEKQEAIFHLIILFVMVGISVTVCLLKNISLRSGLGFVFVAFLAYLLLFKMLFGKKTYQSFYKDMVYPLIYLLLDEYCVEFGHKEYTKVELTDYMNDSFTNYSMKNSYHIYNNDAKANLLDLTLDDETTLESGKKEKQTVFDGYFFHMEYKNSFKVLKNIRIEIRFDDTLISAITEDTIHGIYQSNREFMFNSEELNKAMDCHIRGIDFGDVDELLRRVEKIITPAFEDYLLFLKHRYNSFNMTITDSSINFNVNLKKNLFQKMKEGNLLSFDNTYQECVKNPRLPKPTLIGYQDFLYAEWFPITEHLFLVRYFDDIMQYIFHIEDYQNPHRLDLDTYQEEDMQIAQMKYKEFKEKYKDIIEKIYHERKKEL